MQHDRMATFDVSVARPGSFEMKAVLTDRYGSCQEVFNLSNGLTLRTVRSIRTWFEARLRMNSKIEHEDKNEPSEKAPEPLEDLRAEWVAENIRIEGRKPDLEETEKDTSAQ